MSTGIGFGITIPHCCVPIGSTKSWRLSEDPREGIEFDAWIMRQ